MSKCKFHIGGDDLHYANDYNFVSREWVGVFCNKEGVLKGKTRVLVRIVGRERTPIVHDEKKLLEYLHAENSIPASDVPVFALQGIAVDEETGAKQSDYAYKILRKLIARMEQFLSISTSAKIAYFKQPWGIRSSAPHEKFSKIFEPLGWKYVGIKPYPTATVEQLDRYWWKPLK